MANDMRAAMQRFRSVVQGNVDDAASHGLLEAFIALYAEDAIMYFQGRDWPYAGRHVGRTAIERMFRAGMGLFAAPLEFWENRLWILDEERLLWWWRSRSMTQTGRPMSNSGLTILRYRDDLIIEHHEYTDTEYLAEVFAGWRGQIGAADTTQIPASPPVAPGRAFADSGSHDLDRPWAGFGTHVDDAVTVPASPGHDPT